MLEARLFRHSSDVFDPRKIDEMHAWPRASALLLFSFKLIFGLLLHCFSRFPPRENRNEEKKRTARRAARLKDHVKPGMNTPWTCGKTKKDFYGEILLRGTQGGLSGNGHTPSVTRKLSALPPVPAPKRHLGVSRIETPRNGRLPSVLPLTIGVYAPS